jgi:aconitate hydratase
MSLRNTTREQTYQLRHRLSPRQVDAVLAGGRIPQLAGQND